MGYFLSFSSLFLPSSFSFSLPFLLSPFFPYLFLPSFFPSSVPPPFLSLSFSFFLHKLWPRVFIFDWFTTFLGFKSHTWLGAPVLDSTGLRSQGQILQSGVLSPCQVLPPASCPSPQMSLLYSTILWSIIRNIYLIFIPYSWHRVLEHLNLAVMGVLKGSLVIFMGCLLEST